MGTARKKILTLLFAVLAVGARVGYFIDAPLWLDYFKHNSSASNLNDNCPDTRQFSVYFLLVSQWGFVVLVTGLLLVVLRCRYPGYIGETETQFPKKYFLVIGVSMGLSSVLFNYSVSGSRTPPYLQAILGNCNIPIQFVTRFLVLRKKPTVVKVLCAVSIVLAEVVCLLPTIFPSLEPNSAHTDEGGATGTARVLWPLCMVSSMIPFAVSNTLTERSVQQGRVSGGMLDPSHLNLLYFQFWWSFFVLLTVAAFFWTDIVLGFGTSDSWLEFAEKIKFDFLCLFGAAHCPTSVIVLGWANYVISTVAGYALPALMRYSEGANFVVIILTLRTPLVFLFWSLFDESPFHWHPHLHLSTWLSMGALCVMLPAVICYDMGDDWLAKYREKRKPESDEQSALLPDQPTVQDAVFTTGQGSLDTTGQGSLDTTGQGTLDTTGQGAHQGD